MDYRCKASIEHHQIVCEYRRVSQQLIDGFLFQLSMKDEAFLSEQFRKRCDPEIKQHCSMKKTKFVNIKQKENRTFS